MYNVLFTYQAERDLAYFDQSIADRIIDRIEWLALHADNVIHQRLKGEQWDKSYKLRIGSYRVIPISVRNDTYQDKPENPFPLDGGRLGWG